MNNPLMQVVAVVIVVVGLWKFFPEFRSIVIRFVFGRIDLEFYELPFLLNDLAENNCKRKTEMVDGVQRVMLLHGGMRAWYECHLDGTERASLGVVRRWGLTLTVKDGKVILVTRPWGRTFRAPTLSKKNAASVDLFMRMIREMVDVNA